MSEKTRGIARLSVVYLGAVAVAAATALLLAGNDLLAVAFAADMAATLFVFGVSRLHDNSSMYDPYWSVAPFVLCVYWAVSVGAWDVRTFLVLSLVLTWGARLTFNFLRGFSNLKHEDWRYVDLRRQWKGKYWLVSFSGLHIMPTCLVFAALLPAHAALTATRSFGVLTALGCGLGFCAVAIEGLADEQLRRFRQTNTDPGGILETGLWRYSRHPNYFGECLFWWSVALVGVSAAPQRWWTASGALGITVLFVFASIPLIDARMLAKRPHYRHRMDRVSGLIPWPPR